MSTLLLILGALILLAATAIVYVTLTNRSPDMSRYDDREPAMMVTRDEISEAHQAVIEKLADYHAGPVAKDISTGRRRFASLFENTFDPAEDIRIEATDVDGIPGEWILATNANPSNRLLYLHGGAFMVGSPATHRFITCELARLTGAAVLAVDYRMMPEFTVLNSHEDARSAYLWILAHGPDHEAPCANLFVAGDSAGGALTLATIAWARNNGLQAADGAVAFAPSVDASLSGPTWKTNLATDYFLGPGFGRVLKIPAPIRALLSRKQYGESVTHPGLSPLFGDLGDLPPTLIQVSAEEMLFSDAVRYTNKAREAGSDVTLQVWPALVHVFQLFPELPEANNALSLAAEFIQSRMRSNIEPAG